VFHCWSAVAINSVGVPRITFIGNRCFTCCVRENMERYKSYEKVTYDLEPFIVPGLSNRIELTTSQLPVFGRQSHCENQQTEDTNILPHYRNNHNNNRFFQFWTSKNRTQTKLELVGLDRFWLGLGLFF
jgi:hypothetical protein